MAIAGTVSFVPKGEYNAQTTYKRLNTVRYQNKVYVSLKTVVGVTPSDDKVNWMLFVDTTEIDPSDIAPEFSVAATRENIMTGESLPTLFGKIKKYFTDLKGHAFNDTVNNLTTSTTGSALDASQGNVLQGEVDEINSNLNSYTLSLVYDAVNSGTFKITINKIIREPIIILINSQSIEYQDIFILPISASSSGVSQCGILKKITDGKTNLEVSYNKNILEFNFTLAEWLNMWGNVQVKTFSGKNTSALSLGY